MHPTASRIQSEFSSKAVSISFLAGFATLLVYGAVSDGLHRDEYLYAAYADHVAWSYKESAPLIGAAAWLGKAVFGHSVWALRLWPLLCALATFSILLRIVKWLGGGVLALCLLGLAYTFSPVCIGFAHLFQPNGFELLGYAVVFFFYFLAIKKESHFGWLLVALALGLYAKFSFLYLGFCFLAGLLCTPYSRKRLFSTPILFWVGSLLIVFPLAYWQQIHNWPFIAHMSELKETQLVNQAPFQSFFELPLLFLAGIPILFFGLFGAFSKKHKEFVPLILAWGFTCFFLGISGAKNYYYATPTIVLLLIGAVQAEGWAKTSLRKGILLLPTACLVAFSILLLPILAISLSPSQEEAYMAWAKSIPALKGAFRWEDGQIHALPQDFADKRGWDELTPIVDSVYRTLSPSQKSSCLVFGDNYGHTGALNWYRKPGTHWTAMCLNGSFAYWATLPPTLSTMIYINEGEYQTLYAFFDSISVVGRVRNPKARIYSNEILLCTLPKKEAYAKLQKEFLEAKSTFR